MQNKKLSIDDISVLIVIFAVLFGAWLRLFPVWLAGFPINDGGMFYTMIEDLLLNDYIIPKYTTYNYSNIPFVYPPLGFYIGAILTDVLNFSTPLPVIQWLPGILNSICIFAFYFFAKEITRNKFQSAVSTLVFALTPHMTSWFSMGGGLTRSLGAIFMLAALTYIHRVMVGEDKKDVAGAIIFSGLATLSHTESPIYTIFIAVYIWVMKSRSYKGITKGLIIAIGVLLFISPWLVQTINLHGFTPFVSGLQSGLHSPFSFLRILNVDFVTEETYLDLFGTLGIIGLAILISRKSFFIPGMFLITFLFLPRSAHTLGNIPLAIASGVLLTEVLFPAISNFQALHNTSNKSLQPKYLFFIFTIVPFILANSLYYAFTFSNKHVSEEDRNAMQWIKENTSIESSFLVITGETTGFCDATSEWFPTLANRKSNTTLQGSEWLESKPFSEYIEHTQKIQACYDKGIECILDESKRFSESFDYIYVQLSSTTTRDCNLTNASILPQALMRELEEFPQLQIAFNSNQVIILKKE